VRVFGFLLVFSRMSRLVGRLGHFCSVGGQAGLFVFSFLPVHGDGLTRGDSGFFYRSDSSVFASYKLVFTVCSPNRYRDR
jgi:hypothetical protein